MRKPPHRAFLDLWDGYVLTGDSSEQKLVLNIGTGKNGKSTYTSVKLKLLGSYADSVPASTVMDVGKTRAAGQATPDLAMLRRIRVLLTSEPPKGWKLDEGLIKDLTGGDEVSVRELHRSYFKLKPQFKLTIASNYKPNISAGERESGIWRRVILVDWRVTIPEQDRDLSLQDKLLEEGSGILNRWLAGLTLWLQNGLQIPDEIATATERFRVDSDPVGRFFAECTEQGSGERAPLTATHELFVAWMRAAGEIGRHAWTPIGFSKELRARGYVTHKANVMYWLGFRLTKSISDFVDPDSEPPTAPTADRPASPMCP